MKKIAIMLLAALMLFAFVACDDTQDVEEEAVTLAAGEMGGIKFENADGVTISTTDGKNYTVNGDLETMTAAQAKAFAGLEQTDEVGAWAVGSQYVALNIKAGEDATRVRCGWVSEDNAKKAAADLENTDFNDPKGEKAIDATYSMILAITNGTAVRDEVKDTPVWRIEIKNGTSEDVTVYTVDLSAKIEDASAPVTE